MSQRSVRLPVELWDKIERAAQWHGLTVTGYLRFALTAKVREDLAEIKGEKRPDAAA